MNEQINEKDYVLAAGIMCFISYMNTEWILCCSLWLMMLFFEWQLDWSCWEFCATQDHRLHSGHHCTSEKIYWCHSMMININCCDREIDLKIGRSFCSHKKHDKKNKIVWERWVQLQLTMTVLMQAAAAVSFAPQAQQQAQKQVHKKARQRALEQVRGQAYRQVHK